jgi:hypothetical protein
MSWVLYLFGGGSVFFLGIGFVLVSLGLFAACKKRWARVASTLLAIAGLLLSALSATPIPY